MGTRAETTKKEKAILKFIETQVYDSSMSYVLQSQYGVQTLEQSFQVTPDNFQQVMNTNKNLLFAYYMD